MIKPSSSTRLQELFLLYKSGKLSQEEFDLLKSQILAGVGSQAEAVEKVASPSIAIESVNDASILKLIHEIEVYEIEFHLQNLEANRAAERLAIGERYAQLYDFAPSGYFSLTHQGVIYELNLRGAQMLGKERSLIIKKHFDNFIDDCAKSDFNHFLEKAYASKDIETCEVSVSTNLNTLKYFTISGIIDENEEHCLVTMVDITETKVAQKELEKSREQFNMLMNFFPANVFIKDHESRTIFVNTFMDLSLGGSKWIGKTLSEVFTSPEASRIMNDDRLTLQGGHRIIEESFINLDGKVHHYETQKFVIPQSGKEPLIGGIAMDITERKKLEEALEKERKRLCYILEGTNVGTWEWNIRVGKTTFNDRWAEIIGYTIKELSPYDIDTWISFVHPDDLKISEKLLEKHFKGELEYYECEVRMKHKNGNWIWILDRGSISEWDQEHNPILMSGTHQDITKRKESELELEKLALEIKAKNDELLKLNVEKDKFFSIIAHDLRSPFNNLLGFTNLLVEDLPSLTLDEIGPIAVSMRRSAENLYTLLQNLLEWSMMERGLTVFNPQSVLLADILEPVLDSVHHAADNKMIGIGTDFPENLRVLADEQMFSSLMRNLIVNAIKFTPKGGNVLISAKSLPDNSAEISIRDSGIGMSQDMLDILFSLGANTNRKGTEDEPSTGLGLILCKDYVEKQGGKIYVESEEGKGSTFRFTIPYTI